MANDVTLDPWDGMSPRERVAYAKRLAPELPDGFIYRGIRPYELGDQRHHVAEYEFAGSSFGLIPGGRVSLGCDADRPWEPTPEERESWEGTAEEYGVNRTLQEHIAQATLRPRTVRLPPLLVETAAGELGWEPIAVDDPEVQEIVREHFRKKRDPHSVRVFRSGAGLRVQRGQDGTMTAARAEERTHAELALTSTRVTDAGLKEFKRLKDLRVLHLSFTQVTDAGLKAIQELEGLRELGLENSPVTDAGLKGLKVFTGLRELDLGGTRVTDAGLNELAALRRFQMEKSAPGGPATESNASRAGAGNTCGNSPPGDAK